MGKEQRWRAVGVEERGGRKVAVVINRLTGEEERVYFRLGRWRRYRDDRWVQDQALVATARRALRT